MNLFAVRNVATKEWLEDVRGGPVFRNEMDATRALHARYPATTEEWEVVPVKVTASKK